MGASRTIVSSVTWDDGLVIYHLDLVNLSDCRVCVATSLPGGKWHISNFADAADATATLLKRGRSVGSGPKLSGIRRENTAAEPGEGISIYWKSGARAPLAVSNALAVDDASRRRGSVPSSFVMRPWLILRHKL